ncbi:MAG TPA: thioredoxin domain-containing protein, partial [Nitrososphaera sp.]|nr:thioredoxin domain-containing protein [Nitrososphaera sp.]
HLSLPAGLRSSSLAVCLSIVSLFCFASIFKPLPAQAADKKEERKLPVAPNPNLLFRDGIRLYNDKQYKPALTRFEEVVRARGQDAQAHYYIALCSLALKNNDRAALAFQLAITNATDPQLKELAEKGLKGVQRMKPRATTVSERHGTAGVIKKADEGEEAADKPEEAKPEKPGVKTWVPTDKPEEARLEKPGVKTYISTGKPDEAKHEKPGVKTTVAASKLKKIIEFYASWCPNCKDFAPTFDKARSKFGGTVRFERIDGDDPANATLKTKYEVSGYPTLVYIDANGKAIFIKEGAPSEEEFFSYIEKNK